MSLTEWLAFIMFCILTLCILVPLVTIVWIYILDRRQKEHSVLRNYPVLGNVRYFMENIGPELRQYLFANNREGKPFSRFQYENVVKAGKYKERILGFGSERDFEEPGFYIRNAMFPKLNEELRSDQNPKIKTKLYKIDHEGLFNRREHREDAIVDPYYLTDEDAVVIGERTCRFPFKAKGLVGQSAMSYGALGKNAITALSRGLGLAGGTWMNTGEGGLSKYHLEGDVDIIMQIGPALFGVRTLDGDFSWELFKKKSEIEKIKAFELKLAQGAKTRGGHILGEKVTPEIAGIRNVAPWKTIDSPNRFRDFHDTTSLMDFVEELREVGGKPIGIKVVVGSKAEAEKLAGEMAACGKVPDFITVDGGEGGTGATFQELSDAAGLPLFSALPILDEMLKKYKIRDKLKIIASGKLVTPDKAAYALSLGADLVNTARGMMISAGCIMAQVCHNNTCPVGVATTDPHREKALVIEEKMYRVANYIISLREGLFNLAASAGIATPAEFNEEHVMFKKESGEILTGEEYKKNILVSPAAHEKRELNAETRAK